MKCVFRSFMSVYRKWSILLCALLIMMVTVSSMHCMHGGMHNEQYLQASAQLIQIIKNPLVNFGWAAFFGGLALIAKYKKETHNEDREHVQNTACRALKQVILMRDRRVARVQYRVFASLALLFTLFSFYNAFTTDCGHNF